MSASAYFNQECPICGRYLKVRVSYLGKQVVCQHCSGRFEATDEETASHDSSSSALMQRADELLETASRIHTRVD